MKLKSFSELGKFYRTRKPRTPNPKTIVCTNKVQKDKGNPEKTSPCGAIMRRVLNTNVYICDTCGDFKLVSK